MQLQSARSFPATEISYSSNQDFSDAIVAHIKVTSTYDIMKIN